LQINNIVKMKVLAKDERGYFDLSIKEVHENLEEPKNKNESFEEKLNKFLKKSDERLLDLKRNMESKRSGGGKIKY
ncbi:MAG: RNA-binding protein S1, partial [Nitrospirota bacterium]